MDQSTKTNSHSFRKVVYTLVHQYPSHFLALFSVTALQGIFNGLSVVTIAPIADIVLGKEHTEISKVTQYLFQITDFFQIKPTVGFIFSLFGLFLIISGLIGIGTTYLVARIKYDVLTHLSTSTMTTFFDAKFSFFNSGEIGLFLNSFQKELERIGDTFGQIVSIFVSVLHILIILSIPLMLYPKLSTEFLAITLILSSPLLLLRQWSFRLGNKNTTTANRIATVLHENLTTAKLIIGYARQRRATNLYKQAFLDHARVAVQFTTLIGGISHFFVPIGSIAALTALYRAFVGGHPIGEMAMILFAFFRVLPLSAILLKAKTTIDGFLPAFQQVEELRQKASRLKEQNGNKIFSGLSEGIELKNVSFSYSGNTQALQNLSLSLPRGQLTAFLGKSGSGKSTTVDLIMSLFLADTGQVLVDGHPLEDYNLNSYREKIGYVPQEAQLLNLSIKDNLRWSLPIATDEQILEACKLANADKFVIELPDGFDYVVGDRGNLLSGGQRQRLALARAIIRKPDLLILDEPTSSLDSESETLIQNSIQTLAGHITIVVIAHRIVTIKNADYVYVFDNGTILESGTYSSLSNTDNSYLSTSDFI